MTCLRTLLAYNLKKRRKALGISQEKLAEKVTTSTHYISQIEQKHKFPSPEMLIRLAAALEIDTPQFFSMASYSEQAIKKFQAGVQSDIETAIAQTVAQAVETRMSELTLKPPSPKQ